MNRDPDRSLVLRAQDAAVARLATVRPDGTPHVVAVTFAVDGGRIVTAIDHKPKTTTALQRLANINANPAVSLLVDHYEEDWSQLWWARADGLATVTAPGSPQHGRAVELLAAKYPAYREIAPSGPAITVTVGRWSTWSP